MNVLCWRGFLFVSASFLAFFALITFSSSLTLFLSFALFAASLFSLAAFAATLLASSTGGR